MILRKSIRVICVAGWARWAMGGKTPMEPMSTRQEVQETLHGAGFYATGEHTSYEIYVARDLEHNKGFQKRQLMAKGEVRYSGYYTVEWDDGIELEPGERFAVILYVKTLGAVHPLAIEYRADDATSMADISDGEGYISAGGAVWERAEENYQCNLCLKAYTTIRR